MGGETKPVRRARVEHKVSLTMAGGEKWGASTHEAWKAVRLQCVDKKALRSGKIVGSQSITNAFARKAILEATHMWRAHTKGGRTTGFLLGVRKKLQMEVKLLCSSERQGAVLMKAAEADSKTLGCHTMALRAATRPLISYYHKLGYRRQSACDGSMAALAELDKHATSGRRVNQGWWMMKCL